MTPARVVAVVVAAGMGVRLGREEPKALTPLGGRALVSHAVERLRAGGVDAVVVVHTPGHLEAFRSALDETAVDAWVAGGAERTESVRNGCRLAIEELGAQVVAIHDAARALIPPAVVRATLDALVEADVIGAAPGLPVPDTLKRVDADEDVQATVDRASTWAVHTPQAFLAPVFSDVLDWAEQLGLGGATDDLGLVEAAKGAGVVHGRLRLVRSDPLAGKITWPADLAHAERLLAAGLASLDASETS